jgi:hypothetical protein
MSTAFLRHALFLQATGQPAPQSVSTVIFGWGQYKDQAKLLPKPEQDKLDQLADLIVSSFAQSDLPPFRRVTIVGHADKDWHGAAWENTVSFNRASEVEEELTARVRALWEKRNMGPPPQRGIDTLKEWKGSDQLIAPPFDPRNRRVEITLFRDGPPIPPPPPAENLQGRVTRLLKLLESQKLPGDSSGLRTSRAKCMLSKLTQPGVIDIFVDGSVANQTINGKTPKPEECLIYGRNAGWLGNYDSKKKQMDQPELNKFTRTVRPIINTINSDQTDDHALEVLAAVIQNIDDGMNMVDMYIARMGMMDDPLVKLLLKFEGFAGDVARKKLQSLYRNHLNDQNNIYSCWA